MVMASLGVSQAIFFSNITPTTTPSRFNLTPQKPPSFPLQINPSISIFPRKNRTPQFFRCTPNSTNDTSLNWDWNRWCRHFSDIEQAESFASLLKFQLEDAVEKEEFQEAAKLKRAIEEATSKDSVAEIMSQLKNAIDDERYHDASRLCRYTGSGLVGWWVGYSKNSEDPFGRLIRISPGMGRFVGKIYSPRQLLTSSTGTPLFEIYVVKNADDTYHMQVVYLRRSKGNSTSNPPSIPAKSPSKPEVENLSSVEVEEPEEKVEERNDEKNNNIEAATEEGIKSVINFLKEKIPGLKVKVMNVNVEEEEREGSDSIKQIMEEDGNKTSSTENSEGEVNNMDEPDEINLEGDIDASEEEKEVELFVVASIFACVALGGHHDPNFWAGRTGIVHLFEWKFSDIADECERWLAPKGYAGVQLSPVNENIIIPGRPWWERYQPISYVLTTRSGNEAEFLDMSRRCNAVGIRIYIDILLNHMAADNDNAVGTAGNWADTANRQFPAVPFGPNDFNPRCSIYNWDDPVEIRNCELVGLHDLNQAVEWVRDRLVGFMDHLVELGVAGFRVDAAKHIWPHDLDVIYNRVRDLNTEFGFGPGSRPYIYQEVIDLGGGNGFRYEYTPLGAVTEFMYSSEIGRAFKGWNDLKWLKTIGPAWDMVPSEVALVFVDNHDNQRHGAGGDNVLNYKQSKQYKMATAFTLAWNYGTVRLMSSFGFEDHDQGPPMDANERLISPSINADNSCGNGWICEHRWRQIANMVSFANQVKHTSVNDWWDNGGNKIAFCRGDQGFIAFNNEGTEFNENLQTCLPEGFYCDIITGERLGNMCTGRMIQVGPMQVANIVIPANAVDGVVAIHRGPMSRL